MDMLRIALSDARMRTRLLPKETAWQRSREEALQALAWKYQIKKMLTEVLGRDPKSDALMRARGFDSFKAENKKW
jgi:hypothetical protein